MFSTGLLDELGRILIGKNLRQKLNFIEGDTLTMNVSDGKLIISKSNNNCKICGDTDGLAYIKDIGYICQNCINSIKNHM